MRVFVSHLLAIIALGFLSGCSSHHVLLDRTSWVSTMDNADRFGSDRDMCLGESSIVESKTGVGGLGGGGVYIGGVATSVGPDHDWDAFARCMERHGWRQQAG
jgi:hypothetical protein